MNLFQKCHLMNVLSLLKKNNFFLLFLIIFSVLINAQSKRFYYDLHFKKNASDSIYVKDILVLEVNKNSNIFLSNEYIVTDSLNTVHKDDKVFAYPKFKEVVEYQKDDNSFNFIHNLSMRYYQFNTKKKINWKILNENKKIGNFEVTKAIAEYGGRKWTAWFCPEIPLPYGPYIFYGLPGIILEVFDEDENFHFLFIQNKNYSTELESSDIIKKLFADRKINIQEKDWQKIQLNYYNNPISEYKKGEAYMTKNDGTKYRANDYRNLEKAIQSQIRAFNNPIELDKAVKYPEK